MFLPDCFRCPHINYVTKTDDDVFLNVAALVQRLVNEEDHFRSAFGEATSRSFIIGHVIDSAKPIHDRRFKWYTPKTMFSGEFYPPYVSGTGYSMSTDVARRLIIEVGCAVESSSTKLTVIVNNCLLVCLPSTKRFTYLLTQWQL